MGVTLAERARPVHGAALLAPRASDRQLVTCGAELVAVSERFLHIVFVGALGFVCLSTFASVVFLPLRTSAIDGQPPATALAAGLAVLLLAAASMLRSRHVHRLLRRRVALQLAMIAIAAALVSVASPLRNELWWSACTILMLLATLVPLRRALAFCLVVLLANLAAHVAAGDAEKITSVDVVGLWIGLPFWTALAAVVPDRLAAFILRMNAASVGVAAPPRKVDAWIERDADPAPQRSSKAAAEPAPADRDRVTGRLTARQLQVVALLADGLRYREVADCLAISPGQVHRHVRNAIARAGVATVTELVAVAVKEGVLAPRG